jgi:ribosomal protein S18 acetylase RimI-like enzyme
VETPCPRQAGTASADTLAFNLPLLTCDLPAQGLTAEDRARIREAVESVHYFVEAGALPMQDKLACMRDLLRELNSSSGHRVYDLYGVTERVLRSWGLGDYQKFVEPISTPGTSMIQSLSLIEVTTAPNLVPQIQGRVDEVTRSGEPTTIEVVKVLFGDMFSCVVEWKQGELPFTAEALATRTSEIVSQFATKTPRERAEALGNLLSFIRTIPGTEVRQSPIRIREVISPDNVNEASQFAESLFADNYDRQEIQHLYSCAAFSLKPDSNRFPDLARVRVEEQVLYRDGDGAPLAVSGLQVDEAEPATAEISWFGVAPSAQGGGVGSEVLSLTEEDAQSEGFKELEVIADTTRSDTTRFYGKFGFVFERLVKFGRSLLPRMRKDI